MSKPNRRATTCEAMIDDLDATTLRVLLRLATFGDYATGENARPAIATLADLLGIHRETVKRALSVGIDKGYLTKREQHLEDGNNAPSIYHCLWVQWLMNEQNAKPNNLAQRTHAPTPQRTHAPQPSTLNLPAKPARRKRVAWEQAIIDAKQHRETNKASQ